MIILREGEKLRRRYPGDLKGYGKGTLYLTGGRLAFETERHGLVMDIAFKYLVDWRAKGKRTLAFRWQEPEEDGADVQSTDAMFEAEVELGRKDGKRCDPEEARLSLTLAFTEHFPYGIAGMGFYMNEKGELLNHFDKEGVKPYNGDAYPKEEQAERFEHWWTFHRMWMEKTLVERAGGDHEAVASGGHEAIIEYVERNGGKTHVEQELFRRLVTLRAHEADGGLSASEGLDTPEQEKYAGGEKRCAESLDAEISRCEKTIRKDQAEIDRCRSEGDTESLGRFIEPARRRAEYPHTWPGGTIEDHLAYMKIQLDIAKKTKELMSGMAFDSQRQFLNYETDLRKELGAMAVEGKGVSNCTPEIEMRKLQVPNAKMKADDFGKMLVEAV